MQMAGHVDHARLQCREAISPGKQTREIGHHLGVTEQPAVPGVHGATQAFGQFVGRADRTSGDPRAAANESRRLDCRLRAMRRPASSLHEHIHPPFRRIRRALSFCIK